MLDLAHARDRDRIVDVQVGRRGRFAVFRAMSLNVPPMLLARAEKVIE